MHSQTNAVIWKVFEWTPGAAGCAQSKETQWAGLRRVTVFGEPVPLVLPVTLCWFVFSPNNLHSVLTLSCPVVWCHVLYTLVEICPPILITSVAV